MEDFNQRESLRPPPYPPTSPLYRYLPGAEYGDARLDVLSHVQLARQLGYHKQRVQASISGFPDPPPPSDEAVREALVHETEPAWLDRQKIARAQKFWIQHIAVYSGALFALLVHGFAISRFSEVLAQAGYAKTPWDTHVRFRETGLAIHFWMTSDVTDPNSLGRRSMQQVRWMHAFARSVVLLPGGLWGKEEERERARLQRKGETVDSNKGYIGRPLSQYDLAMTLLGFSAIAMAYMSDDFDVTITEENREDLTHFWRFIGYHLGIRDEYNPCVTAAEAKRSVAEMFALSHVYSGHVRESTALLSHSLITGFGAHTGIPASVYLILPVIPGENREWNLEMFLPSKSNSPSALSLESKKTGIYHSLLVKQWIRSFHRLASCFPWTRTFFNAVVRASLELMSRRPRLATWIEGTILPWVSSLGGVLLRFIEIICLAVRKSRLLTPLLVKY